MHLAACCERVPGPPAPQNLPAPWHLAPVWDGGLSRAGCQHQAPRLGSSWRGTEVTAWQQWPSGGPTTQASCQRRRGAHGGKARWTLCSRQHRAGMDRSLKTPRLRDQRGGQVLAPTEWTCCWQPEQAAALRRDAAACIGPQEISTPGTKHHASPEMLQDGACGYHPTTKAVPKAEPFLAFTAPISLSEQRQAVRRPEGDSGTAQR